MRETEGSIESLAFGGHGIMREDGFVLFVPFAAPGDRLRVIIEKKKKSFGQGRISNICDPSPQRQTPTCPLFTKCGGCHLQHLNYAAQLDAKRRFIEDSLRRIGNQSVSIPPVIASSIPYAYRKHIRLQLRPFQKGFHAGFLGVDNVTFHPVKWCALFAEESSSIWEKVPLLLQKISNEGMGQGALRILKDNILAFDFERKLPDNMSDVIAAFPEFQIFTRSPNGQENNENEYPTIKLCGFELTYSPYGFLQNHLQLSADLYQYLTTLVSGKKILDLYSGIGITSMLLAQKGAMVTAIEENAEAVTLAEKNAKQNKITGIQFIAGKAEKFSSMEDISTVIVNPPRTGLDPELIRTLQNSAVPEVIYISCMPPTLARDLKALDKFKIESVQGFDLFPQTTHVETVVKLRCSL